MIDVEAFLAEPDGQEQVAAIRQAVLNLDTAGAQDLIRDPEDGPLVRNSVTEQWAPSLKCPSCSHDHAHISRLGWLQVEIREAFNIDTQFAHIARDGTPMEAAGYLLCLECFTPVGLPGGMDVNWF